MRVFLTTHQMRNCYRISYGKTVGTAFLYWNSKGVFFLTAAHNLRNAQQGDNVLFQTNEGWVSIPLSRIWYEPDGYDACAFVSDLLPAEYGEQSLLPGDPVKFLGFPHGLSSDYPANGSPTPLVRNAFFSGFAKIGDKLTLILDGFNNPGYSGGPIYADAPDQNLSFIGIISGYRFEDRNHSQIYKVGNDDQEEVIPDVYTKPNSGMIYAVAFGQLQKLFAIVDQFSPIRYPRT